MILISIFCLILLFPLVVLTVPFAMHIIKRDMIKNRMKQRQRRREERALRKAWEEYECE